MMIVKVSSTRARQWCRSGGLSAEEKTASATALPVLQGKPEEEVQELIDASPYAKKYTGVLSFS
nr:hypothetical protein [Pantoea stewartii]